MDKPTNASITRGEYFLLYAGLANSTRSAAGAGRLGFETCSMVEPMNTSPHLGHFTRALTIGLEAFNLAWQWGHSSTYTTLSPTET